MLVQMKRWLPAALLAATIGGVPTSVPASAQAIPTVPGIGQTVSGCALAPDLALCLDAAIPAIPVAIVPSGGVGGSVFGGGNVDVDRDVDSSRVRPTVVFSGP